MSENKENKLTLINEKTANDYLTHTKIRGGLNKEIGYVIVMKHQNYQAAIFRKFCRRYFQDDVKEYLLLSGLFQPVNSVLIKI